MSDRYRHIRANSPRALERAVNEFLSGNPEWKADGGPTEDSARLEWIQAVTRNGNGIKPGEIPLREPKRR